MTEESLSYYAPCPNPRHRAWHDLERGCLLCLYEEKDAKYLESIKKSYEENKGN
jgi:hypothetical protein